MTAPADDGAGASRESVAVDATAATVDAGESSGYHDTTDDFVVSPVVVMVALGRGWRDGGDVVGGTYWHFRDEDV